VSVMERALLRILVPGEPVPKARARTVVRDGKHISYTPKRTVQAEARIRQYVFAARPGQPPFEALPLTVVLLFHMNDITRADVDNLEKLVLDACNKVLWTDDRWVCQVYAEKRPSTSPRTEIGVWLLSQGPRLELWPMEGERP
jgi:Holliday junction resolvase RusA-like endonuclease